MKIKDKNIKRNPRKDNQIRIPVIDLIDNNGVYHKSISTSAAMQMAESVGLNLVEIRADSSPPLCKIMDYGKNQYDEKKKASAARKNHKEIKIKEFKLTPNIGQHDIAIKIKHAREEIEAGNQIKVVLKYKKREIIHKDVGVETVKRFLEGMDDIGQYAAPTVIGNQCVCVVQKKV